jgi:hypothetical protein
LKDRLTVAYGPRFTFGLVNNKDKRFKTMKDSKRLFKNLGLIGMSLCAACCLLPVAGVMLGLGALTFLTEFLEVTGIIAMIAAIALPGIYYFRSKKAPACDVDCECKHK